MKDKILLAVAVGAIKILYDFLGRELAYRQEEAHEKRRRRLG